MKPLLIPNYLLLPTLRSPKSGIVFKERDLIRTRFEKMKGLKNSIEKLFRKKKSVSTQTDLAVVDGEKINITSVELGKIRF